MSFFSDFDRFRQSIDNSFNSFERQMLFDPLTSHVHVLDLTPQARLTSGGAGQQAGGNKDTQVAQQGNGNTSVGTIRSSMPVTIRLDSSEDDSNIYINAELPGVQKTDVKVTVDNNVLTIAADKNQEHKVEDKTRKYTRIERSYGSAQRSLRLPEYADTDNLNAKMQDGVLKITVGKRAVKQPQQNVIQIE
jgi:HSP20 family protein